MLLAALALAAAPAGGIEARPRLLVVAAPSAGDRSLTAQRNALVGWRRGAADRDVRVIEVVGDRVTGARDAAGALRRRYRLPADRFAVVLVGKDGTVALREGAPVLPERLQGTIDAMPMRRAGQR